MHTFAVRMRSARSAIVEALPVRTRADGIARLFAFRPGDTIRLRVPAT
jgi:hypothetical protein